MNPRKVCVIGGGSIGSLHIELHTEKVGSNNVGVIEADPRTQAEFRSKGYIVYDTIDASLVDKYDIYDICLPTFLHGAFIQEVLTKTDAKVLCEKPLVLNKEELAGLIGLYPDIDTRVAGAYVERFNEPFVSAKKWTEAHKGPFRMEFIRRTKRPAHHGWLTDTERGGGVMLDLGIHDVDASVWFTGSRLEGILSHRIGKDDEEFEVAFVDGSKAKFTAGWDIPSNSEAGIVNEFTISSGGDLFRYESGIEAIEMDGIRSHVEPRFPGAYKKEIDASHQFPITRSAAFPVVSEIERTFEIIAVLKGEK